MPGFLESNNSRGFAVLGVFLFLSTFGCSFVLIVLTVIFFFILGVLTALLRNGWERSEELLKEFNAMEGRNSPGIRQFIEIREKKRKQNLYSDKLSGSPQLDVILEEIIAYTLRDYVESWYSLLTNDESLLDSLRTSANRTVSVLSTSLRKVDWTPLLTQHIVDDFASHLRLYRKAKEKVERKRVEREEGTEGGGEDREGELESVFFDLELEMEKSYCRDLVSTDRKYENAYLHDLADILMYLLIPAEDFKSRPFRFLLREVFVRKILCPIMETLSDPDYVNYTIVWLLNDVPITPDDFLCVIEASDSVEELKELKRALDEEVMMQRSKDTGGDDDAAIKQQLSSLGFLKRLVETRARKLKQGDEDVVDAALDGHIIRTEPSKFYDLKLDYVLNNNISISYFMDYLGTVSGVAYIDLFLAIEGFKVSVEHQLSSAHLTRVTTGEPMDPEVLDTIREAGIALYNQYLSDEAMERVDLLDTNLSKNVLARINTEPPSEHWFDDVQTKLFEVMEQDMRFYPAFQRNPLYFRMLADLNLINRDGTPVQDVDVAHCSEAIDGISIKSGYSGSSYQGSTERLMTEEEPLITAHINTIGVGREGNHTFALYSINVNREQTDGSGTQSSWNILRRYSDFHTLHNTIQQRVPNLASLTFPSKKTFNNMNQEFLEKRKRSLNNYLRALLYPAILRQNAGLESIVMTFLCQKEYAPEKGIISKKVLSFVNPIRSGVKSFGNKVTAVPDTFFDGVAKMGDGIGKVTKSVLGVGSSGVPKTDVGVGGGLEGRVGAGISGDVGTDNIPLRILLLLMDEVFGLRHRNQWFRRRLVAFLRQLIHVWFGSSINKKIVDIVAWLTKEEQVAEYLRTFRNTFWPNGVLADSSPPRPEAIQQRTRIVAKAKMLAALPDELRLFIGNETSRSGTELVFEALQNSHLNRRLCYVLLERLLTTVFPENRFEIILPKLHSKSPRCQSASN